MIANSSGANNASIFLIKQIERNPRFDRKQHWAGIGDIGQTYGILGRYWGHSAEIGDIEQILWILGTLVRNLSP